MRKHLSLFLATIILLSICQISFAGDSKTKISGYMFGDLYYVAQNHKSSIEDMNGIQFRRIYFTYDRKLNEKFSSRFRLEMNNAGDFSTKSKMYPFVKDAYLSYQANNGFKIILGISPTPTFEMIDRVWGYRCLVKSPLDLQKLATSRDFGIAFKGNIDSGGKIKYHAMFANGNGKSSETNKGKKGMFELSFYPNKNLIFEIYGDWNNVGVGENRATVQGFFCYRDSEMRLGLQYARQTRMVKNADDEKMDVGSVFFVKKLSAKTNFIIRIDRQFDPNPSGDEISYIPFDNTAKSTFLVTGLDYAPIKDVHLMPNLEIVKYDENDSGTTPKTDVIPRLTFLYKL